jgi:hypothetical protein
MKWKKRKSDIYNRWKERDITSERTLESQYSSLKLFWQLKCLKCWTLRIEVNKIQNMQFEFGY